MPQTMQLGMGDQKFQQLPLPRIDRLGGLAADSSAGASAGRATEGRAAKCRRSAVKSPPQFLLIDAELARQPLYDLLLLDPRVAAGFPA